MSFLTFTNTVSSKALSIDALVTSRAVVIATPDSIKVPKVLANLAILLLDYWTENWHF